MFVLVCNVRNANFEHDMDPVFRLARRVVVLGAGEIIFTGALSEVAAEARVREAYLGSQAGGRRVA
jgi:branched-chain amino acid transport system ATP-binding protein